MENGLLDLGRRQRDWSWVAGAVVGCAAVAGGWVLGAGYAFGLWTEITAAWVQAVGSIIAILASTSLAIGVPEYQRRAARNDARAAALTVLHQVVYQLHEYVAAGVYPVVLQRHRRRAFCLELLAVSQNQLAMIHGPSLGSAGALMAVKNMLTLAVSVRMNAVDESMSDQDFLRRATISAGDAIQIFHNFASYVGSDVTLDPQVILDGMAPEVAKEGMQAAAESESAFEEIVAEQASDQDGAAN